MWHLMLLHDNFFFFFVWLTVHFLFLLISFSIAALDRELANSRATSDIGFAAGDILHKKKSISRDYCELRVCCKMLG